MNLFEKNMESFEKRYPLVAEKIKEIDINNINRHRAVIRFYL